MLITSSLKMSERSGIENKLIRIPSGLREKLGVSVGEFIRLENDLILQVDKPYLIDLQKEGLYKAFVTEEQLQKLHSTYAKEIEVVNTITMGCDPELFIVDHNTHSIINPCNFFNKWDAIGTDGMLCELRPFPHTNPLVVTTNLFGLLGKIKKRFEEEGLKNLKLMGSSAAFGLTAGFHCHMGIPKALLNKRSPSYNKLLNVIVKALDYYLGVLSVIPEGTKENQRRCAPFNDYGKVSDNRVDNTTLEYRVPGGVLLKSPELTAGLLGTCALIATDSVSKIKDYTNNYLKTDLPDATTILAEMYPEIPSLEELFSIICAPCTTKAEALSSGIFNGLEKMIGFDKHKHEVEMFKRNLKVDISNDILHNWWGVNDDYK